MRDSEFNEYEIPGAWQRRGSNPMTHGGGATMHISRMQQ